jgi:hypothetical protein
MLLSTLAIIYFIVCSQAVPVRPGRAALVSDHNVECGFIQHVADLSSTLRIYPARCGFIQHVADLSSTLRIYPARGYLYSTQQEDRKRSALWKPH